MTPALTHEDASARLLDLVYGEAEGAERAALEAHVAGCAACTADLAALGETHTFLRGTFEDLPVPARVHARILEAARAAVAPAQVAAAAPAKPLLALAPPSFWQRMRGKWTFPTLATVGAVAVVVIASKMFLDPNRAFEQMEERRAPVPSEAPGVGQTMPPAAQPRAAESAAPAPFDDLASARSNASASHKPSRLTPETRAGLERLRANAASGGRGSLGSRSIDDRLRGGVGGLDGTRGGGATHNGPGTGAGASRAELSKSVRAQDKPAAEKADKVAAKPAAEPSRDREYASPPDGWKKKGSAAAPAAPAAATVPKRAKKEVFDDPLEGLSGGSSGRAAAPPPPVAAPAPAKRRLEVEAEEADEAPVTAAAPSARADEDYAARAKSAPAESKAKDAAPTFDALVRKADQLFAAHRWQEASAAYRELLRRFPDADPATQWRTRLVQAQRQEAAGKAASKATSAPAKQ